MRFEPSEEAMYRRMDQKERILYLIAACGLIGSFVFLLGVINQNWYVAGGAVCFAVPGVRTEDYAINGVLFRSPARLSAGPAAAAAGTV